MAESRPWIKSREFLDEPRREESWVRGWELRAASVTWHDVDERVREAHVAFRRMAPWSVSTWGTEGMWCFFDESYPPEGGVTSVLACLMREHTVRKLDQIIYRAQKMHFGKDHARDLRCELKGRQLLSATSFRMAQK